MLEYKDIKIEDKEILEEWLKDEEVNSRMGGIEPLDKYLEWAINNVNVIEKMVYDGEKVVGNVTIELKPEANEGHIAIIVNPKHRGEKYGSRILEGIHQHESIEGTMTLIAYIEPDNYSSQKCFENIGYKKGVEENGFIEYRYTNRKNYI